MQPLRKFWEVLENYDLKKILKKCGRVENSGRI
jgi:hypothetical protein